MSNSDKVKNWRKRTKLRMVESLGGKCCICGYNTTVHALEFHHLDPNEKDFGFGASRANIKSWDRLVIELRKCVLVCSNCHREVHDDVAQIPKDVLRFNEDFADYKSLNTQTKVLYKRKFVGYDHCPVCGIEKKENQKYCSTNCSNIGMRVSDRPTKDELTELIETYSWLALGKMFGVSDNAVRKWARTYGII